jgi:hypothetical protein
MGAQALEVRHSTTVAAMNRVRLRGPEHLIGALPYLVGFTPHDSVVLLLLEHTSSEVLLTVRHDLPRDAAQIAVTVDILESAIRSAEASAVVIVIWGSSDEVASGRSPSLVSALVAASESMHVPVRDALVVMGDRWRSALCTSEGCCPRDGRPIDPESVDAIRVPFVLDGRAPARDRAEIERLYSPLPDEHPRVQRLRAAVECEVEFLESRLRIQGAGSLLVEWRRRQADAVLTLMGEAGRLESVIQDQARAVIALQDIHVRDLVIKSLIDHEDPRLIENHLRLLACSTPTELQAPLFALCAALSWQRGDGSRATMALESALASDPSYSLAVLLRRAISAGLPPSRWLDAVRQTSEVECASGPGPTAA